MTTTDDYGRFVAGGASQPVHITNLTLPDGDVTISGATGPNPPADSLSVLPAWIDLGTIFNAQGAAAFSAAIDVRGLGAVSFHVVQASGTLSLEFYGSVTDQQSDAVTLLALSQGTGLLVNSVAATNGVDNVYTVDVSGMRTLWLRVSAIQAGKTVTVKASGAALTPQMFGMYDQIYWPMQPYGLDPSGIKRALTLTPEGALGARAASPTSYRSSLTGADVLAAPGALTTSVVSGGSLTNGQTYNSKVVAGNTYGRTTATAGTARTATAPNLTLRIEIPQVTGATFYDIYVSTDTDPKWVGRITEAQRASGIKIDAVGSTAAGGTAGAVDVEVPGTGLQAATTAAVNTAYSIPAQLIDCSGYQYCDLDVEAIRSGDGVAASLVLLPMFKNTRETLYYASAPIVLSFGGFSGLYQPMRQRIRIEVRDTDMVVLIAAIGGTGMSVDMDHTLC